MKRLAITLVLCAFFSAKAEIFMPKVFSDNMVLQREMPVKIWGKADANANVKVEFAGQVKDATACKNGNWSLHLDPMRANASNRSMQISENGKASKEIKNILVGEVWIAGGQSNMAMPVKSIKAFSSNKNLQDMPLLRYFMQEKNAYASKVQSDSPKGAKWSNLTKASPSEFSATAFFFANRLITELNVPVAIIHTPVGGSRMVAWLGREDFKGVDCLEKSLAGFDEDLANYDYEKALQLNKEKVASLLASGKKSEARNIASKAPKKDAPYNYKHCPSYLYNANIAPVAGFTARGFIWYQGESDIGISDDDNPPELDFYAVFERVIYSWRKYWGNDNMPFYFVQLPSFDLKINWAPARWQQYLVARDVDNVEMIVTIDTGSAKNIHPQDKDIVGGRLGDLALAKTYNLDMKANYPTLANVTYAGDKTELTFDTKGAKLKLKGEPKAFEVLVGGTWQEAEFVELGADKITLKSKNNEEIKGVRYLWKSWVKPDVCLYNEVDLPIMGFVDTI